MYITFSCVSYLELKKIHRIKFGRRSSISFKYVATCHAKAATDSVDHDVVNGCTSIAHITNWLIKNNNIILLMKQ